MTRAILACVLLLGCTQRPKPVKVDGNTAAAIYECITSLEPETAEDWQGAVGECTDGELDTAGWGWN